MTVAYMFALDWGEDGEAWKWRRRLLAWEEELVGECKNLLHNVTLHVDRGSMALNSWTVWGVYCLWRASSSNQSGTTSSYSCVRSHLA